MKNILVKNLQFDFENPRLPVNVRDEADMLDRCLDIGLVRELMLSIGSRGFFRGEPLLVVEKNEHKFVVVHGNQRLAAVKLLLNPRLVDRKSVRNIAADSLHTPIVLPCIVFADRFEILEHMGSAHIGGPVDWGVLAKARYFERYVGIKGLPDIAKSVGVRVRYVQKLLTALVFFQEVVAANFYGIEGLNEVTFSFAYLTAAIDYIGIMEFIENYDRGLSKLVHWFFEKNHGMTRIGSSENLRKLDVVLRSPEALALFENGVDISTAYRIAKGES